LYLSGSDKIVILAHGFTGDKSEWGRFDTVIQALQEAGYAALAFDFSGCGESPDDTLSVEKQVDDLHAAIAFAESKGYNTIGLFGLSLGGLIALKCYSPKIKTMVLWAPVTNQKGSYAEHAFSEEQREELKNKGYLTKTREEGVRNSFQIDQQMITERETVDPNDFKGVDCPLLIIHGSKDERVPLEDSKQAVKILPNAKLHIIEGMDHKGMEQKEEVAGLAEDWFKHNL